ncbi:DUF3732 domain-containing protein [Murimonas intestini]|uniref:Uncharacterized protein DUF3732 n=1 Tax=Murimonas intestini TaxID=1337051 RepID=A0AB73T3Y8_9FIRM|nr:DUF3732 domain-containing protein [Murimonas intestini]MCR1840848.1 DUF3732 domain-containing protein [Murimonas intestini]MCR1866033.1 DUF3732 domain-containing protein [Murimonas intestini]MCR1883453.1 DUF3732 domain-containing protein [Murimonas intestini]
MQIRELVLYGYNGKVRHLPFVLGQVNIITGRSKSGKSVVGDIIDYCLGGDSCNIADGVVRDNASWYGILLQFDCERVFVARKNPDKGQQTTKFCYIEVGEKIEVPEQLNFLSNTNVAGIEQALTSRLGISENLNIPPEGQSRLPLAANIRHALYYCFQGQDEIAAKNFLFHHQSDDFITQAIKDTLPYFLGAVSEEALALENERVLLKRKLVLEKRKLEENRYLMGGGFERAVSLIEEARQVGLIDSLTSVDYQDYHAMYAVLQDAMSWTPSKVESNNAMDRLTFLQSELQKIQEDCDEISINIENAKRFVGETTGYSGEAKHQKVRLESIGLFEQLNFEPEKCPLCSGKLEQPLPSVEMIKTSIKNLDKSIANVTREQPKLRSFISDLEQEREKKQEILRTFEVEIDGLYRQDDDKKRLQDLNARRAKVVGRISLWVESVEADMESEKQEQVIKKIEDRLTEIDSILDRDSVEERKQSVLSRIQGNMTAWAEELQLEHCDNPYRLDLNKVTVIVDKPERPVPLKQLGSGSNWVGVHLITYFALQQFFIMANRPVPSFIFLDQPSQVYFPSELDEKNIDWNEVNKMYQFIIRRTEEMKGKLQVIIVDHAEPNKDKEFYKKYIRENWWPIDKNLVPNDWYESKSQE